MQAYYSKLLLVIFLVVIITLPATSQFIKNSDNVSKKISLKYNSIDSTTMINDNSFPVRYRYNNTSLGLVKNTLILHNGTVLSGNYENNINALSPMDMAIDPNNGLVYLVTSAGNDQIVILNTTTGKIVGNVPVSSGGFSGITYDRSNGYFYVSDVGNVRVLVVNPSTNTVIWNYTLVDGIQTSPYQIAYDNANDELYLTYYASSNLTIINPINNTLDTVNLGLGTYDSVAINDYNGNVYVASDGQVAIINYTTNSISQKFTVGGNRMTQDPMAYDPTNKMMYIVGGNGTLFALNSSSNKIQASLLQNVYPSGITYDSSNGNLYVTVGGPSQMEEVNSSDNQVIIKEQYSAFYSGKYDIIYDSISNKILLPGIYNSIVSFYPINLTIAYNITTGTAPESAAFDSQNGDFFIISEGSNYVTAINSTTDLIKNIDIGSSSYGIEYDPSNQRVYVSASYGLKVINPATENITASITGFKGEAAPGQMAFDKSNDLMYAIDGDTVSSINTNNNTINSTIYFSFNVRDIAYNPSNERIYVSSINADIYEINTSTNKIVSILDINSYLLVPGGVGVTHAIKFLGSEDLMIVPTFKGVVEVNFTNNKVIRVISGLLPYLGVTTYDPINGLLYVGTANFITNKGEIAVVDLKSGDILTNVTTGYFPEGVFFDSITKTVDVLNTYSGTISFISTPRLYSFTVHENGLKNPIQWFFNLTGITIDSGVIDNTTFGVIIPNGSYEYAISTSSIGYDSQFKLGGIIINGQNQEKTVNFSIAPGYYAITFTETGLPTGTEWSMNQSGTRPAFTTSSNITYLEKNGTYKYQASNLTFYYNENNQITVSVMGHKESVTVIFLKWAKINIKILTANVTVYINGKEMNLSKENNPIVVPNGTYSVKAFSKGDQTYITKFTLSPGETKNITIALSPASKEIPLSRIELYAAFMGIIVGIGAISYVTIGRSKR